MRPIAALLCAFLATACIKIRIERRPDGGSSSRQLPALIDPGGCRLEQVTAADGGVGNFQFHGPSPDSRLLLVGWFRGNETGAFLLDLNTGTRTPTPALNNGGAFSPDGKFILVAARQPDGNREIVEYEVSTGATRVVAPSSTPEFLATYSHDGQSVLFNSYRTGRSDIYRVARDDTAVQRLTTFDGYDAHADWSPDQRSVVFHREVTRGDYDIFTLELATGVERLLIGGPGEQAYPAWSPDGRYIAFASDSGNAPGQTDLFVTDAARARTVRLTNAPGYNTYPAWSPDGRTLYFNSERAGRRNVFRMQFTAPMVCRR